MQPDYNKMKVAELKDIAFKKGLNVDGLKKADIIAALEAAEEEAAEVVVLEAEVIEESIERIGYTPAVIDAASYLATKRDWLERMMEPYLDMDDEAIAAMDVKEAKSCRTDLNKIIKEVDDERKAIKNAYNEPLVAFEQAVKELLEPARRDAERLKKYIDDQASVASELRRQGLEATYCDFAPALVPVVPFDRILEINPKWMNASYNAGKAAQELEDAVKKIADDWDALKLQASLMRFYEEAEAVFFRTLSLSAAIAHNDMREAEQQRINAMKAEVAENQAARNHPVPQFEEVPPDELEPKSGFDPETGELIESGPQYGMQASRTSYVIRIDLTPAEKKKLMSYIVSNGIGVYRFIGIAKESSNA